MDFVITIIYGVLILLSFYAGWQKATIVKFLKAEREQVESAVSQLWKERCEKAFKGRAVIQGLTFYRDDVYQALATLLNISVKKAEELIKVEVDTTIDTR